MNTVGLVEVVLGVALLTGGLGYAFRLRAKGGVAVKSRPWYVAVCLSAAGVAILIAGIGILFNG